MFSSEDFAVKQDHTGISASVDAAMSVRAHTFLHASPSNIGNWVSEQRIVHKNVQSTIRVACVHPRKLLDHLLYECE